GHAVARILQQLRARRDPLDARAARSRRRRLAARPAARARPRRPRDARPQHAAQPAGVRLSADLVRPPPDDPRARAAAGLRGPVDMTARHGHLPRALLVAADVAAALVACCAAYLLRIPLKIVPVAGRTDVLPARYLEALPVAVAVILAAVALAGLYDRAHF